MVTFARKQMVRGDNNQLLFLYFFFCIGSDEVVAFLWSAYLWSSCLSGIPFALGSSPGAVSPSYPPLTTNSRHLDVHRPCPALPCPAAAMAQALWARDLTRSCLTEKDAGDFSWFLSLFHFSKKKKKNPFFWCPPQLTQPPGRSPPRSVLPLGGHGGSQQPQMLDLNQNHARWIFQCYCFFLYLIFWFLKKKIVDLFISQVFRTFFCFTLFQSYVDRGHKGSCLLHLFSGL